MGSEYWALINVYTNKYPPGWKQSVFWVSQFLDKVMQFYSTPVQPESVRRALINKLNTFIVSFLTEIIYMSPPSHLVLEQYQQKEVLTLQARYFSGYG